MKLACFYQDSEDYLALYQTGKEECSIVHASTNHVRPYVYIVYCLEQAYEVFKYIVLIDIGATLEDVSFTIGYSHLHP